MDHSRSSRVFSFPRGKLRIGLNKVSWEKYDWNLACLRLKYLLKLYRVLVNPSRIPLHFHFNQLIVHSK